MALPVRKPSGLFGRWSLESPYENGFLSWAASKNPWRRFKGFSEMMSFEDMVRQIKEEKDNPPIQIDDGICVKTYKTKHEALEALEQELNLHASTLDSLACRAARWSSEVYEEKHAQQRSEYCDDTREERFDVFKDEMVKQAFMEEMSVRWAIKRETGLDDVVDVFVVFRGTSTPQDWAANLMCGPDKNMQLCLQGQSFGVHAGFWSKLQECKRSIASELKKLVERKLSKTPWRVVITGHSQGGGLAQLFFLYLQMLRGDPQDFHDVPDKLKEELGYDKTDFSFIWEQGATPKAEEIRCISFAGPSVVSRINSEGDLSAVCFDYRKHLSNYVFHHDPVPRMYSWAPLQSLVQLWGELCMKTQRALNRVPKYLCDIAVKIVTAAGLQPLLAAIAGISAMKNQMHVVKAVCALEAFANHLELVVRDVGKHGQNYVHLAHIKFIKHQALPAPSRKNWLNIELQDVALAHHGMADKYERAIRALQDPKHGFVLEDEDTEPSEMSPRPQEPGDISGKVEEDLDMQIGNAWLAGYDLGETKTDSADALKGALKSELQQQKRQTEIQHEFLDAAKFADFDKMFEMLGRTGGRPDPNRRVWGVPKPNPDGSTRKETVKQRWSAAMQMVYNDASVDDLVRLLKLYPDKQTVLKLSQELKEVTSTLQEEAKEAVSPTAAGEPAAAGRSRGSLDLPHAGAGYGEASGRGGRSRGPSPVPVSEASARGGRSRGSSPVTDDQRLAKVQIVQSLLDRLANESDGISLKDWTWPV